MNVAFRLWDGSNSSGAVVTMAGATHEQGQKLALSPQTKIEGQRGIYILRGIAGADILACSLAVVESCESDACLNLSILNRCCLGVCSCTGGLLGLSSVVSAAFIDITEPRLRDDDPTVAGSSSWELPPPGERCSSCMKSSDGSRILWRRRPALGRLARRRVQGMMILQS